MLKNGVVTIFRSDSISGRLICLGTVPAWICQKKMIRNDGAGIHNDDRFDVRIDRNCISDICAGDLVFFGRAESNCVKLSECRRIEAVTENKYGTVSHWHLAAEYRYSR